ncbi:MAG: hypothetical protein JWM59_3290 [Verrucomicrobiales bacterium]|nr:hypothetical protein [Verrucomicrobiales bacterium]
MIESKSILGRGGNNQVLPPRSAHYRLIINELIEVTKKGNNGQNIAPPLRERRGYADE